MFQPKIHVYFVPGLAAGKEIFKNIILPEDSYEVHVLEWLIPYKKETLQSYAERFAKLVIHDDAVLIGVSFGGVVVQEMSLFLTLKKLIIISSIKTKFETPKRLQYAKKTKAYKLVPTKLVLSAGDLTKFSIGPKSKKRLALYQEYLSVRDKDYLDWAIEQMVCWNREVEVPNVNHIHGIDDAVFPIKNIKDCVLIEKGTHVMIMYKAKAVSSEIVKLIEK
ncbi:MAG: esterase/lipase [Flavobacteriaceae bacterium]|jgi:esterase/lipase|uniref:alpha/beta hydrolase n=1 Tax=Candidatus Marifrigoribacter sp. Uisw_064 TaxID=3230970 RepID=UPI003AD989D4